ncbi:MAG: methylated-DNA--[protein]-cysteine S-methyltransferase [Defluviitaleaceae bacterium]|nr:methylated-DNA--[protein]-cysteine S-methyltransferase [Defluviitaleaceae bacterium]
MTHREYASPVGILTLVSDGEFITEIKYKNCATPQGNDAILEKCAEELDAYFAGKLREFTVPTKPEGTAFRKRVWKELKKIPHGEVISYKELAKRVGNPKASRAVGGANHHNPINIIIPCHRVIGASGKLTGYGGGLDNKEFLLNLERQ